MTNIGLQNKFNDYVFDSQKKDIDKTVGTQVSEKKLGEIMNLIKDSPLSADEKNKLKEAVKTDSLSDGEKQLLNSLNSNIKDTVKEVSKNNKVEVNNYKTFETAKEFKMPE